VRAEYGATLLYMGKDAEARRAITEALAASPGDLTARYYQGLLLVKERAFEQAALNFVPLNGWQVLQTITRLQEDRELVVGLTSTEGYRNLARALLNAKTGDDTETVLARVKQHLQDVQPLMQAGQWAAAEPHLRAAYQTGARFPALEYDLGLCRYSMDAGPRTAGRTGETYCLPARHRLPAPFHLSMLPGRGRRPRRTDHRRVFAGRPGPRGGSAARSHPTGPER
jgi:hypothetical protein